jgi:hypothetical protein
MVRFVGLSQPFKLSVFSVDRSAFVDRLVERVGRLKISNFKPIARSGRNRWGQECSAITYRTPR